MNHATSSLMRAGMSGISFLIPALNEQANIGPCINAIQQFGPKTCGVEIIVGDHGSSDGTANIATNLGARVVGLQGGTVAALRNYLVSKSTGWLIVFVDADVRLTADWMQAFEAVATTLRQNPGQLIGSHCMPPSSDNLIIKHWFAQMPTADRSYLGTGHILFTRAIFEEIGGFNGALCTGEDYDFCMRARSKGFTINANPMLRVIHHDYPLTIAAFLRRERWHGSGDFQSIANLARSKIALLTLGFFGLHIVMLVSLLIDRRWALGCAIAILLTVVAVSVVKFPRLHHASRIKNVFLFYCYLVGRTWSFLSLSKSTPPKASRVA